MRLPHAARLEACELDMGLLAGEGFPAITDGAMQGASHEDIRKRPVIPS
jgi:hypothetical protein